MTGRVVEALVLLVAGAALTFVGNLLPQSLWADPLALASLFAGMFCFALGLTSLCVAWAFRASGRTPS